MAQSLSPGMIGFAHTENIFGRAIRSAERRYGVEDYWNHVFALSHIDDGEWFVIQAELHGVTNDKTLNSVGEHTLVSFPETADVQKFLDFLDSQVGDDYGFLTIASDAAGLYLPEDVCVRQSGTWVCSGLIMGALWYAGWPPAMAVKDLYSTIPSWLGQRLGAPTPQDKQGSHVIA